MKAGLMAIYRPNLDNNRRGDQAFYYPVGVAIANPNPKGNGNGRIQETQLETIVFKRKGITFLDPENWEKAKAHPPNKPEIERMISEGILRIYAPDSEVVTGSTTDFNSLDVAKKIVEASTDKQWLERCRSRDPRPPVDAAISQRLAELDDEVRAQKGWMGVGVV